MTDSILIIDQNPSEAKELCSRLEEFSFTGVCLNSLGDLEKHLEGRGGAVVLIDLDSDLVDNRGIREIKRRFPATTIMGLSNRRFHPDLKDAIETCIYAVIGKPVDSEELTFLLRSVHKKEGRGSDAPE